MMVPNKRFRRTVVFQVALSSTLFLSSTGHWCEKLSHDKLSSLRQKIDSFFGFAVLCPFTIEGSGCDDDNLGYDVSTHNVHLQCQDMNPQTGKMTKNHSCIIDCPGRHFTIKPTFSLTLDGILLRGATNTSIKIESGAKLLSFKARWERNSQSSNGGAIFASEGSYLSLIRSSFHSNWASNGGAIYTLGSGEISWGDFEENMATNGKGGAIYANGDETITVIKESRFVDYVSEAAIVDLNSVVNANGNCNKGCGSRSGCIGIYDVNTEICDEFELLDDTECMAGDSNSGPSSDGSAIPSSNNSEKPSISASLATKAPSKKSKSSKSSKKKRSKTTSQLK